MIDVVYSTQRLNCVTIDIEDEVTWWTHQQVYDALVAQAPDLAYLQAHKFQLFIHVRSDPVTVPGHGSSNSMYSRPYPECRAGGGYSACTLVDIITLQAHPDRQDFHPDAYLGPEYVMAHEFGHAWIDYFRLKYHNESYDEYVAQRNLVPGSYAATHPQEVAAEDYRICFGTPEAAAGEMAPSGAARPTTEQCAFLANTWRVMQ